MATFRIIEKQIFPVTADVVQCPKLNKTAYVNTDCRGCYCFKGRWVRATDNGASTVCCEFKE